MSGDSPAASAALRTASVAITLITIVTFATVGYSAYQAYVSVTSPGFRDALSRTASVAGSSVVIRVSGSFRNGGLYPIGLSTFVGLPSGGRAGRISSSPVVTIPAGSTAGFNLSTSVDPFDSLPPATLTEAFYEGADLNLTTGFTATLVPFAGLTVGIPTPLHLPPFAGDVHVSSVTATQGTLSVALEFTNQEPIPYQFSAYGALASPSGALLHSSTVSGLSSPQATTRLALSFSAQSFVPGGYVLTLHISVAGHDMITTLRVEVS